MVLDVSSFSNTMGARGIIIFVYNEGTTLCEFPIDGSAGWMFSFGPSAFRTEARG